MENGLTVSLLLSLSSESPGSRVGCRVRAAVAHQDEVWHSASSEQDEDEEEEQDIVRREEKKKEE